MKEESEELSDALRKIAKKAVSADPRGVTPPYGKRDKFWVAENASLFEHQNGGTYLLVFRTRGKLVKFHQEDPNLQEISRRETRMMRYTQIRDLCVDQGWHGIILDPPLPTDDNPNAPVEVLALAPPGR